jgi:hypothetical protein
MKLQSLVCPIGSVSARRCCLQPAGAIDFGRGAGVAVHPLSRAMVAGLGLRKEPCHRVLLSNKESA